MDNETRTSRKKQGMSNSIKGLIAIGFLGGAVLTGTVVGILATPKIEKPQEKPESAISRVTSQNSESEAKADDKAESTGSKSQDSVDSNKNNQTVIQQNSENVIDTEKANAFRYGTANKGLWDVRERILIKVYKHLNGDSPVGFGIRMSEIPEGFVIYAGQQGPGQLVGRVIDNGDGTFTFSDVTNGTQLTFNA